MNQPKFIVGSKVKVKSDLSEQEREVLSYSFNTTDGFRYTISSIEVDTQAKKLINGVMHCNEDELSAEIMEATNE